MKNTWKYRSLDEQNFYNQNTGDVNKSKFVVDYPDLSRKVLTFQNVKLLILIGLPISFRKKMKFTDKFAPYKKQLVNENTQKCING